MPKRTVRALAGRRRTRCSTVLTNFGSKRVDCAADTCGRQRQTVRARDCQSRFHACPQGHMFIMRNGHYQCFTRGIIPIALLMIAPTTFRSNRIASNLSSAKRSARLSNDSSLSPSLRKPSNSEGSSNLTPCHYMLSKQEATQVDQLYETVQLASCPVFVTLVLPGSPLVGLVIRQAASTKI